MKLTTSVSASSRKKGRLPLERNLRFSLTVWIVHVYLLAETVEVHYALLDTFTITMSSAELFTYDLIHSERGVSNDCGIRLQYVSVSGLLTCV